MLTREGMTISRRRVALQVTSVRFLSPLKGQTEHLQLSLHGVEISGPLTARIKVSVRSTIFFRHEIILFRSRHVSPVGRSKRSCRFCFWRTHWESQSLYHKGVFYIKFAFAELSIKLIIYLSHVIIVTTQSLFRNALDIDTSRWRLKVSIGKRLFFGGNGKKNKYCLIRS